MADLRPALPTSEGDAVKKNKFSSRWLKKRLTMIAMFFSITLILFWYYASFGSGRPQAHTPTRPHGSNESLIVVLPNYGSFRGIRMVADLKQTKAFNKSIDAWLSVEYSTQPVGDHRFKPVTWPKPFEDIRDAKSFGPACYQNVFASFQQSEACLTLNIYRPSRISLNETLPILLFLHGGSFVGGSHRSFDGALFVEKSPQPLMVITAQYRLGALGSLPGRFMEEEGLLDLGIRDQRMALEFMQEYAQAFGGDPRRITLAGQSAGGHSVGIHLFHNYGEDTGKPLFHQAILSSGSPTARSFPGVDYPLYQRQVEQFMDYVNCPTSPSAAALECLRNAEVDDIQFISSSLYNAYNYNITWPWQPVSPGPLLEKRGSSSGEDGTFYKIPILVSSTTDEGKAFAPQDLTTNDDYIRFWSNLAPGLTTDDLANLEMLYPDPETNADSPYAIHSQNYISPQFERIAAAYGDYSYICPVQDTASRLSSAGSPVYKARFNTPNFAPSYLGVPHASDAPYFNGKEDAQYPEIAELYSAYWASFVVSGDPNRFARKGATEWIKYQGAGSQVLVVNPPTKGGISMEEEHNGIRMKQCAWWRDGARAKRLNK